MNPGITVQYESLSTYFTLRARIRFNFQNPSGLGSYSMKNIHINHISLHSCRLRTGPFPLIAVFRHEWCPLLDVFCHRAWERWRQKLDKWNRLWSLGVWKPLAIKAYYNYYNNNYYYNYVPVTSMISGVSTAQCPCHSYVATGEC